MPQRSPRIWGLCWLASEVSSPSNLICAYARCTQSSSLLEPLFQDINRLLSSQMEDMDWPLLDQNFAESVYKRDVKKVIRGMKVSLLWNGNNNPFVLSIGYLPTVHQVVESSQEWLYHLQITIDSFYIADDMLYTLNALFWQAWSRHEGSLIIRSHRCTSVETGLVDILLRCIPIIIAASVASHG